jgi:hypothetical protein
VQFFESFPIIEKLSEMWCSFGLFGSGGQAPDDFRGKAESIGGLNGTGLTEITSRE